MAASSDEHSCDPDGWLDIAAAMPGPASETPSIIREWSDSMTKREAALAAARQLLADTAEAVTPGMTATELLTCLARYRAHLAALVAAYSMQTPLARTVDETAAALAVSPRTVYPMVNGADLLTYRIARRCIRIDELALGDYYLADRIIEPHGRTS